MVKLRLILIFCVVVVVVAAAVPVFSGNAQGPEDVEKWYRELGDYKEKVTKLHFYFHDLRGKTSVIVAQQASSTPKSPNFFGATSIMDDPLTAGPEFTSKPVGRAQGLFSSSALKEPSSLLCIMNFVFTDDKYNGSTLTIVVHFHMNQNPHFHMDQTPTFETLTEEFIHEFCYDDTEDDRILELYHERHGQSSRSMPRKSIFRDREAASPVINQYRELSALGGSGVFRLASPVINQYRELSALGGSGELRLASPVINHYRELSALDGSGVFRLALPSGTCYSTNLQFEIYIVNINLENAFKEYACKIRNIEKL
ncbi:hypothetical protein POM88_053594 [Heracleum sosnowskyi]|uniref:Dirigent protein n=1 Tax=Heracleum sosnowskyi TaxID=360622 RepID=A0AAD8GQE9_9APIA|nr:hypothetical protein POM88_053594 [Heracleum sosnowskyi]